MNTFTFTRSHALYRTRWCDPFEVNTLDGEGWMLLDLPGAPCDVTQPSMRTMSQRLRKAEQCAAAGGKYGLLQAVLLSLDSQPITPAQWVREAVALEACSRVLLPEAHEVPLDLDAARAAYQQLTPAEQRLWKQLQAARIQFKYSNTYSNRRSKDALENIAGYQPKGAYTADVLGSVTGDVYLSAHEILRPAVWMGQFGMAAKIATLHGLVGSGTNPASMQAAYNWALSCYYHHGRDHPDTKTALAATHQADPESWVPKLLAGLAYPPLSLAPACVPGGIMEATGYAHQFGDLWSFSSAYFTEGAVISVHESYSSYSAPLQWLLSAHGIAIPTPQQQQDVQAVRRLTCGAPFAAERASFETMTEASDLCEYSNWSAFRERCEQRGAARLLRGLVAGVSSWAAFTMNLPPMAAAPRLWEGVSTEFAREQLGHTASALLSMFAWAVPNTLDMIHHYSNTLRGDPAAAAALGFWNPHELDYLGALVPSLSLAAARWQWQCGDADGAQNSCRLDHPGVPLSWLHDAVVRGTPPWLQIMADGVVPASTQPIDTLVEFVAQEQLQTPGTDLSWVVDAHEAGASRGPDAARAFITQLGDPQEQRLYDLFPGWLDQLVSQVTGREVTLVIEPAAADNIPGFTHWPAVSVHLKDASSGQQQLFHWKQPGDADCRAAHRLLIDQENQGTDWELRWGDAAMEPYAGAQSAGSSSSSSGSRRRLTVSRGQQGHTAQGSPGVQAGGAVASGTAGNSAGAASVACGADNTPQTETAGCTGAKAEQGIHPLASAAVQAAATAAAGGGAGSSRTAAVGSSAASRPAAAGGVHAGSGHGAASSGGGGSSTGKVKPSRPCAQCGELFPKLQQCSRCKAVAYCSRDCQLAHWKAGHKEACHERPMV